MDIQVGGRGGEASSSEFLGQLRSLWFESCALLRQKTHTVNRPNTDMSL